MAQPTQATIQAQMIAAIASARVRVASDSAAAWMEAHSPSLNLGLETVGLGCQCG